MSVKIGVIGCGAIGQRRHIPEAAGNARVELVAVADSNVGRAEEVGQKYGAKAFGDWRELVALAGLDAVVVGTPNYLHAEQAIAALEAGKHVLVEKPMATTREQARAMIAAADKAGKFLMVGQNQRLMPPHVKAWEILRRGDLGRVMSFRTAFQHGGPEGWSLDGSKSWFFRKDEAVMGVTGDLGVHKIDLLRYLLGQEFVEVSAQLSTQDKKTPDGKLIELDDNAYMIAKTADGVVGSIIVSWTNYSSYLEENYTYVFCEHGVVVIGDDKDYGVIVYYKNGNRELHKVGAIATNARQTNSGVVDLFVECIVTKTPPVISGAEGYKALDVILSAMESSRTGRAIKIG